MDKKALLAGALLTVGVAASGSVVAAGYCSQGLATEGISPTDMTWIGVGAATDCYGVVAVNTPADLSLWSTDWTLLDKTDDAGFPSYYGLDFVITAAGGGSGTWALSWTGTFNDPANPLDTLPQNFDFVFGLKAGPEYAAYLFDNVLIGASPGGASGTYSIVFTNPGGQIPDLSHISLYGYYDPAGGPAYVPVPAAVWLFGSALVGFMTWSRRRAA